MKKYIISSVVFCMIILSCGCSTQYPEVSKRGFHPIEESTESELVDLGEESEPIEKATSEEANAEKVMDSHEDEGRVLNIWCWNDEFQSRFNDFYPEVLLVSEDKSTTTLKNGTIVNWTIHIYDENNYQMKLDEALLEQESKPADEKIDIFLVEADTALKYADSPYTLDVRSDLGLTDKDLMRQYSYTQDIVSVDGVLKGTSWQATPGLFVYRRSIALDVLGTQDPHEVQEALSDWTKFDAVAELAAEKGYKMLSGYDDSYRVFSNNVSAPWVEGTTVTIDANIMKWVEQTKSYTENKYNNQTSLWDEDWAADQGPEGDVFGFFYSTWGINFTLMGNALAVPEIEGGKLEVGNGIYGDYAVCEGPQSYYWGGTWICGATGTDNKYLVADIMRQLTCNEYIMQKITEETQDYTNNALAMGVLAINGFQSSFLGGQNHIALFVKSAPTINMSNICKYDQGLNEGFQHVFKEYFQGLVDLETAKKNFELLAVETYPELTDFVW